MKRTRAEANAVAKTGSISNVRALSGYVKTRDGETLAFSILANNFTIPAATVNWIADLAVETPGELHADDESLSGDQETSCEADAVTSVSAPPGRTSVRPASRLTSSSGSVAAFCSAGIARLGERAVLGERYRRGLADRRLLVRRAP